MKRNVYFLLIAVLLSIMTLQACSGGTTEESTVQQALVPPEILAQSGADSLAGAAGGSATATVPALCSGADDTDRAAFATEVIRLVNVERAKVGAGALVAQDQLSQAAQKHTIDMGCNFFMSHTGSDGSTLATRLVSFGYTSYIKAGENVAAGYATPQEVMDAWMASSGHRANILDPVFTEIGIGYVVNFDDPEYYSYYWTMDLGKK